MAIIPVVASRLTKSRTTSCGVFGWITFSYVLAENGLVAASNQPLRWSGGKIETNIAGATLA